MIPDCPDCPDCPDTQESYASLNDSELKRYPSILLQRLLQVIINDNPTFPLVYARKDPGSGEW
jgi:hypothetical protein